MPKVLLITHDESDSIDQELASALPACYQVTRARQDAVFSGDGLACVVFDMDSVDIKAIKDYSRKALVIAVTAVNCATPVMAAATSGAYEIMHRPLNKETLGLILREFDQLMQELNGAVDIFEDAADPAACAIIGHSPHVMTLCEKVARIARVDVPVLVTGETGTGKELVAEAIAQQSHRYAKPFVVINAAAVPDTLLESELFGHERGAFTGAVASKEGMIKTADAGCIFFDEIGDLPLHLQGKLLRFLQTQTFYPVGSTREIHVNVRVISATNRDLISMVREGKFREDLYHRLRVAEVHVPPLRERKKDIQPLVQSMFFRYVQTARKPIHGVTKAFLEKLHTYEWPGNIRELENTIRSAIAVCKTDYLTTNELRDLGVHTIVRRTEGPAEAVQPPILTMLKRGLQNGVKNLYETIHAEVDGQILKFIMSHTRDNQSEAARLLGINRLTLRKKLGIQK